MTEPRTSSSGRSRNVQWLVVLAGVLAVVVWYQFFRTTGSGPAASNPITPRGAAAAGPLPSPQVLRLAELDAVGEFAEPGRNPFTFGARPSPPPSARPSSSPVSGPVMAPPQAPAVPQGPPPIGLKLTGLTVVPGDVRPMVTLKDPASNAVFQAFEGDIVDGRYRIVKVGVQSVVVSYVDGTGLRTISLGG